MHLTTLRQQHTRPWRVQETPCGRIKVCRSALETTGRLHLNHACFTGGHEIWNVPPRLTSLYPLLLAEARCKCMISCIDLPGILLVFGVLCVLWWREHLGPWVNIPVVHHYKNTMLPVGVQTSPKYKHVCLVGKMFLKYRNGYLKYSLCSPLLQINVCWNVLPHILKVA